MRPGSEYTAAELARHASSESLWVVIDSNVYDVTEFRTMHPGGAQILLQHGGSDATVPAQAAHGSSKKARSLMSRYCIGRLADGEVASDSKALTLEELGNSAVATAPAVQAPGKVVALEDLFQGEE